MVSAPVPSWRPEAARLLAEQWTGRQSLTVLTPESRNGQRADRYETQVDWTGRLHVHLPRALKKPVDPRTANPDQETSR
ncbi:MULTISPECIES: hypothetical protein [Streptomyces]|uniref:Uncharacterized protein n=1 Tax=Streptomyces canarius TaxID=285453 RepID=A0ABQ3DBH6_9ACTN|nr:hypothetical protein [Streptomyces canarius]GHA65840.1 hypothetical protein GCM10010345_82170 [Streptomyces canarius]